MLAPTLTITFSRFQEASFSVRGFHLGAPTNGVNNDEDGLDPRSGYRGMGSQKPGSRQLCTRNVEAVLDGEGRAIKEMEL